MPSVSVVIPCYNAAPFVAATLRSVLTQDVGSDDDDRLEVIVVDDGSADGSADIVARDFPQVALVRQRNAGVAAARNAGIARARGEWVAFVDADDIWLPGKLRAQFDALRARPDAAMAYTAWHVWPCDDPEPSPQLVDELINVPAGGVWAGPSEWIYPELLLDCEVWTSTVVVRRRLLEEEGGFDEQLRIGEDWDLWLRLSRRTPIVRVERPLALYRHHPSSITRQPPAQNFKHLLIHRALDRWGPVGPDGRRVSDAAIARSQARTWRDLAGMRLSRGDALAARRDAWRAVRCRPANLHGWHVLVKATARSLWAPPKASRA